MADVTLRIEYDGGGSDTLDAVAGQYTHAIEEQSRGEARVLRDDWKDVESSIDELNDKFFIVVDGTDEFGGRLDDTQTDGQTVSVRLNSPEIDAAEAEPTAANLHYQNATDDTIVTDAIQTVPALSAGTVQNVGGPYNYSASHASQSKVIRDQREATGAEILYNADWTVDYVSRLGADKAITLGPAEANIGDDFSKTVDVREHITHVRALGAEQGPNQLVKEATSSSYSSGRQHWKRYENKEIIDESRLQAIATLLAGVYDGEPRSITVECTVFGEDLELGDRVTVDYPEEDINRQLRIIKMTTEITRRGYLLLCTLSNRALDVVSRETKRNDDLNRFNRGHQGFIDRDQVTSGWNPAGDGVPQTLEVVNWPDDIVSEETVELTVLGRAWRSPVKAGGHTHSVDVTHPQHSHSVDVDHPSHAHTFTYGVNDHVHNLDFDVIQTGDDPGHSHDSWAPSAATTLYSGPFAAVTSNPNSTSTTTKTSQTALGTTQSETSSAELGTTTSETTDSVTDLIAEVIDTFNGNQYWPTDVEIHVNGTLETTLAGNATADWDATVDLSGLLTSGRNTITATPTSQRGSLNLALASELYRRGEINTP